MPYLERTRTQNLDSGPTLVSLHSDRDGELALGSKMSMTAHTHFVRFASSKVLIGEYVWYWVSGGFWRLTPRDLEVAWEDTGQDSLASLQN